MDRLSRYAELIVRVGVNGARDVQPQVPEFLAQGWAGDPQQAGRRVRVAVRIIQHQGQEEAVQPWAAKQRVVT